VEQALDRYGERIAILGGLDVDFLCRAEPAEIEKRARALVERSLEQGGYALGSGNSIARYIPLPAIHAMQRAAGVR
jgi:uroporphyrinogen decarboxylase